MFFVLGSGRCGTKSLARALAGIPGLACVHEPEPALIRESALYRYGDLDAAEIGRMLRDTRPAEVDGRVRGESNQALSLLVPVLARTFPAARYIWLMRSGLDVVASICGRQWYTGRTVTHAYEDCSPIQRAWIDWRVQGDRCGEVAPDEWAAMSAFAKCCWYWGYVNRTLESDLAAHVAPSAARLLRLEDAAVDIGNIVAWLGGNGGALPVLDRDNQAHYQPYRWQLWSVAQRRTFLHWCGDLMDRYYPRWRTEMPEFFSGLSNSRYAPADAREEGPFRPRVSVYITSYNQKAWLAEAIDSVLAQTVRPHEIIIVDDCSTDGSRDLIESYRQRHPELIKPVLNEQNRGVSQSRVNALHFVTGDYVTYLDGDDRFLPSKLEHELDTLKANPDAHIVYSNYYYIDEAGRRTGVWSEGGLLPQGDVFKQVFARAFPHNTLFRNELVNFRALREIGFHDPKLAVYEDYELRIRMTAGMRACYCGEPLAEYRLHQRGLSRVNYGRHLDALDYIIQKNAGLLARLPDGEGEECLAMLRAWMSRVIVPGAEEEVARAGRSRRPPDKELGENLIFLISLPRSGSTLLQRVLGGHTDIHSLPEPWIMLHPLYALKREGYETEYEASLARLALDDFLASIGAREGAYIEAVRAFATRLYGKAMEREPEKRYFLDKTPRYFYVLPELQRVFPKAKFVVLLRNPLAVLSSVLETWFENDPERLARAYNHADVYRGPSLLAAGLAALGPRAIVVRYEDLVSDPEFEIRRLCVRLEIAYDPRMLEYGSRGHIEGRFGDQVGVVRHSRPVRDSLGKCLLNLAAPKLNQLARGYLDALGPDLVGRLGYGFERLQGDLEDPAAAAAALAARASVPGAPGDTAAGVRVPAPELYAQALSAEGEALYRRGDLDEAWSRFERAHRIAPGDNAVCNNFAVALYHRGDSKGALTVWRQVLARDPGNREALLNCGQVLARLGEFSLAQELYANYSKFNPGDEEARRLARQPVAPVPTDAEVARLNEEGEGLYREGDLAGAADRFEAAFALDPGEALTRNNLAASAWQQGERQRARHLLSGALTTAPLDPTAIMNYLTVAAELGDAAAVDETRGLLSAYPEHGPRLDELAARARAHLSGPDRCAARDFLVTAIVSVYESERFLAGCLEDLEAQTIADRLEIIVVDAGSPQNEGGIVREFQQRYDNIRYIRLPERETIYQAWNRGVRMARGKYLTNANADDRHRADALEILVDALESRPEAVLAYADSIQTHAENQSFAQCTPSAYYRWPDFTRGRLLERCIIGPQPLWRRAIHDSEGYFDERYYCAADYEFWLRIAGRHEFVHVPELLGLFWECPGSISRRGDRPACERGEIQERYRRRYLELAPPVAIDPAPYHALLRLALEQARLDVLLPGPPDMELAADLERIAGVRVHTIPDLSQPEARGRPWDVLIAAAVDLGNSPARALAGMDFRYLLPAKVAGNAAQWSSLGFQELDHGTGVYELVNRAALGIALYEEGAIPAAVSLFQQILLEHPEDRDALSYLGRHAMESGDLERAGELLGAAVGVDRRHVVAVEGLSRLCALLGRGEAAAQLQGYVQRLRRAEWQAAAADAAKNPFQLGVEHFRMPLRPGLEELRVLCFADPAGSPGTVPCLLEAVSILKSRGVGVHCTLALLNEASAWIGELRTDIQRRGLRDCAALADPGCVQELLNLYGRHNVLFSYDGVKDAIPLPEAQAMAAGLLLLATPGSPAAGLLRAGAAGVQINRSDPLFVAAELAQLVIDRARWDRLAQAGERWVGQYPTFGAAFDQLAEHAGHAAAAGAP